MSRVRIDGSRIVDDETFHDEFSRALGFPGFYGRNMNAWIDCMSYVDEPNAGMTNVHIDRGGMLVLEVTDAEGLQSRCPSLMTDLVLCSAFVNRRYVDDGESPPLALVFLA